MRALTSEAFVRQWAGENGFTVTPGWSDGMGPPAFVLIDNRQITCVYRGETIELAFSRMESALKSEDPFA